MKITKITSLGCSSCIIVNNIIEELKDKYQLNITNYDFDFDEDIVSKYNIGKILPVIIFFDNNDNEIHRITGEKSKKEIIEIIEKYTNK